MRKDAQQRPVDQPIKVFAQLHGSDGSGEGNYARMEWLKHWQNILLSGERVRQHSISVKKKKTCKKRQITVLHLVVPYPARILKPLWFIPW